MIWLIIALLLILAYGIYRMTAAYKRRTSAVVSGLSGVNDFEDFISTTVGSPYTSFLNNAGSIAQIQLGDRSTLIRLHNDASTDVAGISTNGGAILVENGTSTSIATDVSINGFPSNSPGSTFVFGFASNANPVANPGVDSYLKFDRSVSANWIAIRRDGTTTSQTVTAVPATLDTAGGSTNTFTTLKVIVTQRQAQYFVNSVLVASINQDWSAVVALIGPTCVLTSSGTPDITNAYPDYMWLIHNFATVRPTP